MTVYIDAYVQQLAQMASSICGLDPNVILAHWDAEQGISSVSDWYYYNPAGLNHGLSQADALANGVGVDNLLTFPTPAAGATAYAYFIKYDSAFSGIRAAISTGNPANELNAIWQSPWAASHYNGGTSLISAYNTITGQNVQITSGSGPNFYPTADNITTTPNNFPETNYSVVANSLRTGDVLYGRMWRIYVTGSHGLSLDVSDLHCTFDIQTVIQQGITPPFCTVEIYNLDPETENAILNYGDRVVVEAGYYGNQYGTIFDGELIEPIRDKPDNVSYRLTLNCLANNALMTSSINSLTVSRGENQRSIVKKVASTATVPTALGDISPMLSTAGLPRGKAFFGMTRDILNQIAQGNDLAFHTSHGVINLVHPSDPGKGRIYKLDSTSGLIGQPTQASYGVQFQCLLNPIFQMYDFVQIDNSLIAPATYTVGQRPLPLSQDGLYRIYSIEHQGDTRGQNWYTTCQTVSQAGIIPGMATTANSNIMG